MRISVEKFLLPVSSVQKCSPKRLQLSYFLLNSTKMKFIFSSTHYTPYSLSAVQSYTLIHIHTNPSYKMYAIKMRSGVKFTMSLPTIGEICCNTECDNKSGSNNSNENYSNNKSSNHSWCIKGQQTKCNDIKSGKNKCNRHFYYIKQNKNIYNNNAATIAAAVVWQPTTLTMQLICKPNSVDTKQTGSRSSNNLCIVVVVRHCIVAAI